MRAATGSGDAGSAATAAAVKMSAADVEQKYGDVLPTIGCRAVMLLNELPLPQAHYRALLVAKLLCDLPSERAAVLANISAGAVRKYCARFPDGNIGEFAQIYPAGVTHARVPELEIQAIIEFIKEHCPARSGTPREHYVQLLTSEELYQEYQAHYAKLLEQVVAAAKADPKARDQAAMQTLLQKVEAHQRGLAFLSALQSPAAEPAAVRAFAGGVLPGPAQLVVDYVLEGLPSIPKPTPRSRAVFEALKAELPLSNPHNYYGQFDCSVCNQQFHMVSPLRPQVLVLGWASSSSSLAPCKWTSPATASSTISILESGSLWCIKTTWCKTSICGGRKSRLSTPRRRPPKALSKCTLESARKNLQPSAHRKSSSALWGYRQFSLDFDY